MYPRCATSAAECQNFGSFCLCVLPSNVHIVVGASSAESVLLDQPWQTPYLRRGWCNSVKRPWAICSLIGARSQTGSIICGINLRRCTLWTPIIPHLGIQMLTQQKWTALSETRTAPQTHSLSHGLDLDSLVNPDGLLLLVHAISHKRRSKTRNGHVPHTHTTNHKSTPISLGPFSHKHARTHTHTQPPPIITLWPFQFQCICLCCPEKTTFSWIYKALHKCCKSIAAATADCSP